MQGCSTDEAACTHYHHEHAWATCKPGIIPKDPRHLHMDAADVYLDRTEGAGSTVSEELAAAVATAVGVPRGYVSNQIVVGFLCGSCKCRLAASKNAEELAAAFGRALALCHGVLAVEGGVARAVEAVLLMPK